jgi:hypothetical protein
VEDLVAFALDDLADLGGRRPELARHVQGCGSCRREVRAVRASHATLGTSAERSALARLLSAPFAAPLAAGVVLALLAYPTFLGLVQLPRERQDLQALERRVEEFDSTVTSLQASHQQVQEQLRSLSSWTGGIVVPLLAAPVRAEAATPTTIPLQEGQPFVVVAVDPGLPAEDAEDYLAEVLTVPGDRVVWSLRIEPQELKRQVALAGSAAFLIPAASLAPGDYRFRMTARGTRGEARLLQAPLTITAPAD